MCLRELPKATAKMAPPGGDNKMGVKKEIPSKPYLFQILTNRLLCGEKVLLNLKKRIKAECLNCSPKTLKIEIVVIIPAIVSTVETSG